MEEHGAQCPQCGSERLRWAEMFGRNLWGECRHCGYVHLIAGDVVDEDEDDGYRFDPVTGESRLYREA